MTRKKTLLLRFLPISVLLLLVATSCSKYEKLLKSSDNELKYQKAFEYYNKKKYGRAVSLFESLVMVYSNTPRSDTVYFYRAKSYYMDSDPFTAEVYFGEFKNIFPRSPFAEEASYLQGVCLYDASYRPDLDPGPNQKALTVFNEYNYSYPNSPHKEEVQAMSEELVKRLMTKSFQAGKFYYKVEDYRSAITTLKNCLKDYPDTPYREEILYLILRSNYLYAHHSIRERQMERYQSTIDEYYNFISEFPKSKHIKDAQSMYAKATEATNRDKQQIIDKEKKEETTESK